MNTQWFDGHTALSDCENIFCIWCGFALNFILKEINLSAEFIWINGELLGGKRNCMKKVKIILSIKSNKKENRLNVASSSNVIFL